MEKETPRNLFRKIFTPHCQEIEQNQIRKLENEKSNSELQESSYSVIKAARESVISSKPTISYSEATDIAVKEVVASINNKIKSSIRGNKDR